MKWMSVFWEISSTRIVRTVLYSTEYIAVVRTPLPFFITLYFKFKKLQYYLAQSVHSY